MSKVGEEKGLRAVPGGKMAGAEPRTSGGTSPGWRLTLASFVLLVAVLLVLVSPLFGVREIVVEGTRVLSATQVRELARVRPGQSIVLLDEARIRERLLLHPRILRAEVKREWPARVIIRVTEREAVALLPAGSIFLALDQAGIPFGLADPAKEKELPIITGLELPIPTMGVPLTHPELKVALAAVTALPAALAGKVAEVHVTGEGPAARVRLYLSSLLAIDLPAAPEEFPKALSMLAAVWPEISTRGAGWVVDLSSSRGVVLRREEGKTQGSVE